MSTESSHEASSPEILADSVKHLKRILATKNIELTPSTIMKCLRYAMEVAELSKVKGPERKKLAVLLIQTIVEESNISEANKSILRNIINEDVLDDAIEVIIAASRGSIDVNKVQTQISWCCANLF